MIGCSETYSGMAAARTRLDVDVWVGVPAVFRGEWPVDRLVGIDLGVADGAWADPAVTPDDVPWPEPEPEPEPDVSLSAPAPGVLVAASPPLGAP